MSWWTFIIDRKESIKTRCHPESCSFCWSDCEEGTYSTSWIVYQGNEMEGGSSEQLIHSWQKAVHCCHWGKENYYLRREKASCNNMLGNCWCIFNSWFHHNFPRTLFLSLYLLVSFSLEVVVRVCFVVSSLEVWLQGILKALCFCKMYCDPLNLFSAG